MNRRVLFYSSVSDKDLFRITGFYRTDIQILEDLGYKVILSNSFKDFFIFWKYDISFIYFWTKGLIPAGISKLVHKKVIFTGGMDNLDLEYNNSILNYNIKKFIFKLCTIFSDANIIVSNADLNNINNTKYKIKNIYLIPHVIEFKKYKYDNTLKNNIITTIVWMGSKGNVLRKGVDKILYIYKEFLNYNNNYTVVIIGSKGEGTKYLEEISKKMGIFYKVKFTGRIKEEEKIKYLRTSKFYFQLSEYEGFGIAAIEALAAGNIVIHSGKGGLKDALGPYGVKVKDRMNYNEIACLLRDIDNKYKEYFDFINDGIKYVEDNFSYRIRKNGIAKILKNII